MSSLINNRRAPLVNVGKKRAGPSTIIKTPIHFSLGENIMDNRSNSSAKLLSSDTAIVLVDDADVHDTAELEVTITSNRRGIVISTTAVANDRNARYDSSTIRTPPVTSNTTPIRHRYNLTALVESTTLRYKKTPEIAGDTFKDPLTTFLQQAISQGVIGGDDSNVHNRSTGAKNKKQMACTGNMTSDTFILVRQSYSVSHTPMLIGVPVDKGLWRMRRELPDIDALYKQRDPSSGDSVSKAWALLVTPIEVLKKKAAVTELTAEEEAGGDGIGGDTSSGRVLPQGTAKGGFGLTTFTSIAERIEKDESDTMLLKGIMNEVHKNIYSTENSSAEGTSRDSAAIAGAKKVAGAVHAATVLHQRHIIDSGGKSKKHRAEQSVSDQNISTTVPKRDNTEESCGVPNSVISDINTNADTNIDNSPKNVSPMEHFMSHVDVIISRYIADNPALNTVSKEAVSTITKAVVVEVKKVPSNLKGYSRDEMRDFLIGLKKCVEEALARRIGI